MNEVALPFVFILAHVYPAASGQCDLPHWSLEVESSQV